MNAIVSVLSFGPILWKLSGSLTLFGLTIPKALFWLVLVYVFVVSLAAFRLGHPLIRLSFRNERPTPHSATGWCDFVMSANRWRSPAASRPRSVP